MAKPTEDVRELLRAIQTEIGAGKGSGMAFMDREQQTFSRYAGGC